MVTEEEMTKILKDLFSDSSELPNVVREAIERLVSTDEIDELARKAIEVIRIQTLAGELTQWLGEGHHPSEVLDLDEDAFQSMTMLLADEIIQSSQQVPDENDHFQDKQSNAVQAVLVMGLTIGAEYVRRFINAEVDPGPRS